MLDICGDQLSDPEAGISRVEPTALAVEHRE